MSKVAYPRIGLLVRVVAVMAIPSILIGCAPDAPADPAGKTLELSLSRANPGEFITLSHDGITSGDILNIDFETSDGLIVEIESLDVRDGEVDVAVPAYVDAAAATIGAGTVTVSIQGLEGEAALDINEPFALDGVTPGTVLALFLESAIADYQTTVDNLTAIGVEFGETEGLEAIEAINARMAELQAQVAQIETSGELTVDLGDMGVVTLAGDDLHLADRLLVNMILGLDEADSTGAQKGSAAYRSLSECTPNPPPGMTAVECVEEVVRERLNDVRQFTQENGTKVAGYLATGVGVVVTIYGIGQTAPLIALTGLITTVAGGTVSFTDAALQGKNTDSFLQRDGEGFNVGVEILSQTGRVLVSAASTGFSALENAFSTALDTLDKGVAAMDGYNGLMCSDKEPQEKHRSFLLELDDIGFCSVTQGAGCSNTCLLSFNGVCDDGGEGAVGSLCDFGTDCSDCGARGEVDGPVPPEPSRGSCENTCFLSFDGLCDDGGEGAVSSLCDFGTDCSDCGARGEDNVPEPVEPTGACCSSGVCTIMTSAECAAVDGAVYSGDDSDCALVECAPPVEYIIWYTGNVCCWGAPLMYISTRESFEESAPASSSFPGGGIDPSIPVEKVEFQGGFATYEEAQAWVCPQFESSSYHYWCTRHYQMGGMNWQPGSLGCELDDLPEPAAYPEVSGCE